MTNSIIILDNILGANRVKENFNLTPYLTLRTQTYAQYYFEANSRQDLINAKKASLESGLQILIIGGGSNLAISKKILTGLIVRNKYIEKKILEKKTDSARYQISSGYPVTKLVKELCDEGVAGLEYHFGLPGTVGGALYMNSKWTHPLTYFGDNLVYANTLTPNGSVAKRMRDYFQFAYDSSTLQKSKETVIEAVFNFKKEDPIILNKRAKDAMEYRKKTQPFGVFSSGCFFRNISSSDQKRLGLTTSSAGNLIDKSGMKGKMLGSFYVSDKHANFILNKGNGDSKDLIKLISAVKEEVRKKFGVTLEEEVIVI